MERRSQPPALIQFSETVSFHDQVGFAIQFMNIVVASALVVVGLAKFQFPTEDEGEALALDLKHLFSLYFFLVGVPLAVIFAVVAAITIKFNRWVITSFLGFTALASLAYLIICFVLGKWATGIFGALIVIVALAPFAIRFKSVLVVEAFVNHSFHVIKEDPRLAIPALAFGFISTFWSILWSVFILMVHSSSYPHAVRVILILVLLASWVLTTLFLRAYSHIMMSGIVSVWYFHDRKAPHGAPSSLVWSAKRTIKLVGSAAMASVFSTIGALARFVFQLIPIQLHGNKYFRMASNFSLYYQNQSLADVMCHNHTFLQADVLVRHAIQEKIFEPIFELFFVERFMTCMALLAALIGGSLGGLSAHIFGWDAHVLSFIVVGAALGFTIVLACLEVFTVMSSTTFVCLAQDPGTVAPLKVPELVDNLKELFPAIRTL